MSRLGISIIFLLLVGAFIIIISIWAYNRRLDKVARGEMRDTHSNLPEPGTTAGVTYRTVLMILALGMIFGISNLHGLIVAGSDQISSLQQTQHQLSREISDLQRQLEQAGKAVQDTYWVIDQVDYEKRTAQMQYCVKMKEFSDDMKVTLHLNGKEIPLNMGNPGNLTGNPGVFAGQLSLNFFDDYGQAQLSIKEGGRTKLEEVDFPQYVFWDFLSMPSLECNLQSDVNHGKWNYEGSYRIVVGNLESVEKVTIAYMTGDKELKSMDVTKEVFDQSWITLEKGLQPDKDLSVRIEITMKEGLRIVEKTALMYEASPDFTDTDYCKVLDADGKTLWEDDMK